MLAGMSAPYRLPDHAPSRTVRPGESPTPAAARAQLAREGVDVTDLDALCRFLAEQGWVWRLAGGRNYPRCWAATVAPWVSRDPWAEAWGDGLAQAWSMVLLLTLTTPPAELVGGGRGKARNHHSPQHPRPATDRAQDGPRSDR